MSDQKNRVEKKKNVNIRQRIYRMVSVNVVDEKANQIYDVASTGALILNLAVTFMGTYEELSAKYGGLFSVIEAVTVFIFLVDYVLRLITAKFQYPRLSEGRAVFKYVISFTGIVDLLSFLPYYMPVFFPAGAAVFRIFRVARILRLFRINSHYDSLNVITEVIVSKKQQLLSSVFIIITLMLGSSLCMYSVEHEAQPLVFRNAFSGIWWSASTLLTVGYGDIYPVTSMGKLLGIIISFLGVGMVAIPTGIISAGFVEQYSHLKKLGESLAGEDVQFVRISLGKKDKWVGCAIKDLGLPKDISVSMVQRDQEILIPRGDLVLAGGDEVVIGAQTVKGNKKPLNMKEIVLTSQHPWNDTAIRDLDISRQTFIVTVKRRGRTMLPEGGLVLTEGDKVLLYSKKHTMMTSEDYV
ncbi:MAG: ion transporter [Lachnospiraceae bacterium]|nr:ion transporter [Lachnospiraceae bacterium]